MYKTVQINYCRKVLCVTAWPCVLTSVPLTYASILKLQSVKIGGSLVRNARFGAPTCLVSRLWFARGFAVSMGEAAKPVLLFHV